MVTTDRIEPFNMLVPPQWTRFDLLEPLAEPVRRAVAPLVAAVPAAQREPMRAELERSIGDSLAGLAETGAVAALLPAEDPTTAAVFPVIAIRPADFVVDGEPIAPIDFLLALIAAGEGELIEPPGMIGVRRLTLVDASRQMRDRIEALPQELARAVLAGGVETDSARWTRRLEYTIGVPESDGKWMTVFATFTVPDGDDGEAVAQAVMEFLDAWIGTITWDGPEAGDE